MLSKLWGRITGADKGKQFPSQQGVALSRVGDYTVLWPYGYFANAPEGQLFKEIAPGVIMPLTVERPDDVAQGEPAFFHPATNTRIIPRNDGTLDIYSESAVNVHAPETNLGDGGEPIARVGDSVEVVITSGSSSGTWAGTITSGGANSSI